MAHIAVCKQQHKHRVVDVIEVVVVVLIAAIVVVERY
jgi:hypothetical protein